MDKFKIGDIVLYRNNNDALYCWSGTIWKIIDCTESKEWSRGVLLYDPKEAWSKVFPFSLKESILYIGNLIKINNIDIETFKVLYD